MNRNLRYTLSAKGKRAAARIRVLREWRNDHGAICSCFACVHKRMGGWR